MSHTLSHILGILRRWPARLAVATVALTPIGAACRDDASDDSSSSAPDGSKLDARTNNGINEFTIVTNRANYLLPARSDRGFPLLATEADL